MSDQDTLQIIESTRASWMGVRTPLPAKIKVDCLRLLLDAGLRRLDAFAFMKTRMQPQMSDSEDVLRRLEAPEGSSLSALTLDPRGVERAAATKKLSRIVFPYSLSPLHMRAVYAQSPEENYENLEAVAVKAEENGLTVTAQICMAFGNHYGDFWSLDELLQAVDNVAEMGVESVCLEDTSASSPENLSELLSAVAQRFGKLPVGVALYGEPERVAMLAGRALDAGCRRFHVSTGGVARAVQADGKPQARMLSTEALLAAIARRDLPSPEVAPLERAVYMLRDLDEHYR